MQDNRFSKKLCTHNSGSHTLQKKKHLSAVISFWLLIIVGIVFLTASLIVFLLLAIDNRNTYLSTMKSFTELDIEALDNQIADARAKKLKNVASVISGVLDWDDMKREERLNRLLVQWVSEEYISELDIVDPDGKVVYSNQEHIVGDDLANNDCYAPVLALFDQPDGTVAVCSDAPISETPSETPLETPIQNYTAMKLDAHDLVLLMGTTKTDEEFIRKNVIDDYLTEDMSLYSIGETGYVLRADMNMTVQTSNREQYIGMNLHDMGFPFEKDEEYIGSSTLSIDGEKVFVYADNSQGLFIIYVFTVREAMAEPMRTLEFLLTVLIVVCLVIYLVVTFLIRVKILNNIDKVNASLSDIVQGNLDRKVDVRDSLEFDSLSEGINSTVDRLKELIDETGKRIDQELAFAKAVQFSSLPPFSSISSRNEIVLDAYMEPAREVGGDFYDFFLIGENKLGLLIADVSGKGISAAMFMMKSEALIRERAMQGGTPGEILRDVNAALLEGTQTYYFVTVWFAILDLKTGEGIAVNAGHTDPIVRRNSGVFKFERCIHQLVVGVMEGINYVSEDFRLNPGDCLFLYTDGVIEAMNSSRELFGKERTVNVLNQNPDAPPQELIRNVRSALTDFAGDTEQFDDITMLCVEYIGPQNEQISD